MGYNKTMTPFQKKVFSLVVKIPKGRLATYGDLARHLKTSPRAIGQALHTNPEPVKIPCHRVVKSNGEIGGYFGKNKSREKIRLLENEEIKITNNKIANLKKYLIKFKT